MKVFSEGYTKSHSNAATAHELLGEALLQAGQPLDAVSELRTALALDPSPTRERPHLQLARAMRAAGLHGEAENAYQMVLRVREAVEPGLYGEDVYLELRETCQINGHKAAADNAWRMWVESYWLADITGRSIYCPIAKNACTFFKAALALNSHRAEEFLTSNQDSHVFTRTRVNGLRLGDARLISDPRFFSFILLRDPFERLASAYWYNFVRPLKWREIPDAPGRPLVVSAHLRQGSEPNWKNSISFAEFINEIVIRSDADLDHHWRPQSAFFKDLSDFTYVGCVERIDETLAQLTQHRGWHFNFDADRYRNAMSRAILPAANYAWMPPRQLADLPGFPSAERLFTDELRELVSKRYQADLLQHASLMDQVTEPVYPTGGALAVQGDTSAESTFGHSSLAHPAPSSRNASPHSAVALAVDVSELAASSPAVTSSKMPLAVGLAKVGISVDTTSILHASPEGRADGVGTLASPLEVGVAIRQALSLQASGAAVRVLLAGGIYRVQVSVKGTIDAIASVTIEAALTDPAVFSGADSYDDPADWTLIDGQWFRDWPYDTDPAPAPDDFGDPWLRVPELMLRREAVYVDGRQLRQVLTSAMLEPGCFCIDRGRLLVHPPRGVQLGVCSIDVARRDGLLQLREVAHLTLRGLHFRHAAGAPFTSGSGALRITASRHVQIFDCQTCDNNNRGLLVDGACHDIMLQRVRASHNGCQGVLVSRVECLRMLECETSFNNWRGAWAGYYRRAPSGIKVWRSRDVRLIQHRALHNEATGLWIDEDNEGVTIEAAQVVGNRRGIHIEAGDGPVDIVDSCIIGNRQEPRPDVFRWAFGSGIAITHASNVSVRRCLICNNDVAQVGVRDDREVRRIKLAADIPPRLFRTNDLHLVDNTIVADARGAWLRLPDKDFDDGHCLCSLVSQGNRFISGCQPQGVVISSRVDGMARLRALTLAQWRDFAGQDMESTVNG
jgi:hypothetical protein